MGSKESRPQIGEPSEIMCQYCGEDVIEVTLVESPEYITCNGAERVFTVECRKGHSGKACFDGDGLMKLTGDVGFGSDEDFHMISVWYYNATPVEYLNYNNSDDKLEFRSDDFVGWSIDKVYKCECQPNDITSSQFDREKAKKHVKAVKNNWGEERVASSD